VVSPGAQALRPTASRVGACIRGFTAPNIWGGSGRTAGYVTIASPSCANKREAEQ